MTTRTRKKKAERPNDNKVFKGHKPGSERPLRAADIKENEVPVHIVKAWEACRFPKKEPELEEGPEEHLHYNAAEKALEGLKVTATDIETFSVLLERFQEDRHFSMKAGFFLSVLINNCNEKRYVLHTTGLRKKIDMLCCAAGFGGGMKEVLVDGDVGDYFAAWMFEGVVIVKGNAGHHIKEGAVGGTVLVKGDVGDFAANKMDGGYLVVENAGDSAGNILLAGTIIINGDAGDLLGCRMGNSDRVEFDEEEYRTIIARGKVGKDVGYGMKSGRIFLWDKYLSISKEIFGGTVLHKEELLVNK